jgi:hypothetical protein
VADDGGTNSMLQFRLERGGDRTKHYRKMKRRQRAHLGSIGRKRDRTRQRGDVDQRRGGTVEGKMKKTTLVGLTRIIIGLKMKKIYAIDLATTNER